MIPPPKVSFYEPEKRTRVEIPKENRKGVGKQAIDIDKIQISAQLPHKIDTKSLAQTAFTTEKDRPEQDLLTSLPPQIYEIKPVQKHLSRANTSQADKRFNKKDPFSQTSPTRWSSKSDSSSTGTPHLALPIRTSRPGFSLSAPDKPSLNSGSSALDKKPVLPTISPKEKERGQLDDVLSISPFVYIDEEQQQGYFQIDISLNQKSTRLESLNKEILFLLDTSTSISKAQLHSFTYAIEKSLDGLQPTDFFNIVSFTTKNKYLFSNYVPASESNKKAAREFLAKAKSRGKTDVYRSLRPFITQKQSSKIPRIIYLATDGVTTSFRGYEGSEIIRRSTADNTNGTSIFTLSCGEDSDAFLLDLLTLRNRGFSLRRPKTEGSDQLFKNFIKAHSDIVVSNLNYQFSGHIDTAEIFPKELPHLYRGGTLSIYGKFNPSEKNSLVQIRGLGLEREEEITFKVNFSEAQKSSPLLAKNWAHRKILALLGELTENPKDREIKKALQDLVIEYQIPIPYNLAK